MQLVQVRGSGKVSRPVKCLLPFSGGGRLLVAFEADKFRSSYRRRPSQDRESADFTPFELNTRRSISGSGADEIFNEVSVVSTVLSRVIRLLLTTCFWLFRPITKREAQS